MNFTKNFLFLDTNILLDLAKGAYRDEDLILNTLNELMGSRHFNLVLSEQVIVEWERNKEKKVIEHLKASTRSRYKDIKSAALFLNDTDGQRLKDLVDELISKIEPTIASRVQKIDEIIGRAIRCSSNNRVKELVVKFGVEGKKPFTKEKNSTADAVIFFSAVEYMNLQPESDNVHDYIEGYFVSANTKDFSKDNGDQNSIHDHLQPYQGRLKYSINIGETINEIEKRNIINQEVLEIISSGYKITCPKCNTELREKRDGFLRPSIYGGGLSHWMKCKNCGYQWDTGDYWD